MGIFGDRDRRGRGWGSRVRGRLVPAVGLTLALAAGAALLLAGNGCSPGKEEHGGGGRALSPEELQEREARARELFAEAQRSTVPDKVRILRRLVGRYPETRHAPGARFMLVQYLLDSVVDRPEEALEQTRSFAREHPGLLDWCESFRMILGHEKARHDEAWRSKVLDAWEQALEGATPQDREARAVLAYERFRLANRRQDKEAARGHLQDCVDLEPEDKQLLKQALVQLAELQAEVPGQRDAARRSLERVIAICEAGHTVGFTAEDAREQMARLGL